MQDRITCRPKNKRQSMTAMAADNNKVDVIFFVLPSRDHPEALENAVEQADQFPGSIWYEWVLKPPGTDRRVVEHRRRPVRISARTYRHCPRRG